ARGAARRPRDGAARSAASRPPPGGAPSGPGGPRGRGAPRGRPPNAPPAATAAAGSAAPARIPPARPRPGPCRANGPAARADRPPAAPAPAGGGPTAGRSRRCPVPAQGGVGAPPDSADGPCPPCAAGQRYGESFPQEPSLRRHAPPSGHLTFCARSRCYSPDDRRSGLAPGRRRHSGRTRLRVAAETRSCSGGSTSSHADAHHHPPSPSAGDPAPEHRTSRRGRMSADRRHGTRRRAVLGTWSADSGTGLWDQAFPAQAWRAVLGEATVSLEIDGGPAQLWSARSGRRRLVTRSAAGRLDLPLEADGAEWFWVEGPVRSVTWCAAVGADLPEVAVVMPTRLREQDAIAQSARFARMDLVRRVIVVDQGGTLADLPEFARLRAEHPAITLISQPNLGGSGGYARGMLEASADPAAAVLFSDDHAVLSEESLRRMVTYQALAPRPTILGTPLFSSDRPTRLLAHSERVGAREFQWRAADRVHGAVDLAGTTPADWTFVDPGSPANYTGWWGTLFPPGTAQRLGLPAPLFLKWDDAEYGLRATQHGFDHAVLPGTSVHHPPWTAFRTQMTWTARVLHRNRLAIAAAYGAGRGVIASSLLHQVKHVLAGHLLTAELWEDAIDAMRAGPDAWMGRDLQRARDDGDRIVRAW